LSALPGASCGLLARLWLCEFANSGDAILISQGCLAELSIVLRIHHLKLHERNGFFVELFQVNQEFGSPRGSVCVSEVALKGTALDQRFVGDAYEGDLLKVEGDLAQPRPSPALDAIQFVLRFFALKRLVPLLKSPCVVVVSHVAERQNHTDLAVLLNGGGDGLAVVDDNIVAAGVNGVGLKTLLQNF
jgi:hypothetical protein